MQLPSNATKSQIVTAVNTNDPGAGANVLQIGGVLYAPRPQPGPPGFVQLQLIGIKQIDTSGNPTGAALGTGWYAAGTITGVNSTPPDPTQPLQMSNIYGSLPTTCNCYAVNVGEAQLSPSTTYTDSTGTVAPGPFHALGSGVVPTSPSSSSSSGSNAVGTPGQYLAVPTGTSTNDGFPVYRILFEIPNATGQYQYLGSAGSTQPAALFDYPRIGI